MFGRARKARDMRKLVIEMARANLAWGYTKIRDALRTGPKIEIGRTTVANILAEAGIKPAPERDKKRTWKQLMKMHRESLYACDQGPGWLGERQRNERSKHVTLTAREFLERRPSGSRVGRGNGFSDSTGDLRRASSQALTPALVGAWPGPVDRSSRPRWRCSGRSASG
jgi:hypothetical protein